MSDDDDEVDDNKKVAVTIPGYFIFYSTLPPFSPPLFVTSVAFLQTAPSSLTGWTS